MCRVRERGYRVSDNYGSYKNNIHDVIVNTIRLHPEGDLCWSSIDRAQVASGAYELTYQEIINLLYNTEVNVTCEDSDIDCLTIEEMAKQIQLLTDESAKINETLTKLKQALIRKLA